MRLPLPEQASGRAVQDLPAIDRGANHPPHRAAFLLQPIEAMGRYANVDYLAHAEDNGASIIRKWRTRAGTPPSLSPSHELSGVLRGPGG